MWSVLFNITLTYYIDAVSRLHVFSTIFLVNSDWKWTLCRCCCLCRPLKGALTKYTIIVFYTNKLLVKNQVIHMFMHLWKCMRLGCWNEYYPCKAWHVNYSLKIQFSWTKDKIFVKNTFLHILIFWSIRLVWFI